MYKKEQKLPDMSNELTKKLKNNEVILKGGYD
jgi:hypothetical protein